MNASPFAKELYKSVRNKVKKLDDIQRIEDRIQENKAVKGAPAIVLTDEQKEKMDNKEEYVKSVQQTIELFEIYKQTELANLLQKQTEVPKETPKEEIKEEVKEPVPAAP